MKEYMSFGWSKVEDHRGLSASRTVDKMAAWLWLLGDEGLVAYCESGEDYAQYGAPILKTICDKYGFPVPDNEEIRKMSNGEPCEPDCSGCEY